MIRLVDDQGLGAILRDSERAEGEVFTTGFWFVRLCQAVLSANAGGGVLSGPFAALPADMRDRAIRSLLALPDDIGLVSLRELAPLIGQLRARHQLNILGMEALAAAVHLNGDNDVLVELSARSPKLEMAFEAESVSVRII